MLFALVFGFALFFAAVVFTAFDTGLDFEAFFAAVLVANEGLTIFGFSLFGIDSIKESWKQTLKRYDYIVDLCNKFDKIINIFLFSDKTGVNDRLYRQGGIKIWNKISGILKITTNS